MRYPELRKAFYSPSRFPDDGHLWRIEWLGRLQRNFERPYNHLLEVTLCRLRGKSRGTEVTLKDALDVDPNHRDRAYIDIRDLPYVHVGSIWRDGKYVASPEYALFESDRLVFAESTLRLIRWDSPDPLAGDCRVIPPDLHAIGCDPLHACLLAVEVNGDPYSLLIPAMEVVRFYYCPLPVMAEQLFRGPFDLISNKLYNADKSGLDPDGICRACFRNRIPTPAARIVTVLACSEYARRQARRIYDSILVNQIANGTPVVEALPPFEGRAELKAHGAWFESNGRKRFLAYRIVASNLPVPGRKLLYAWSNMAILFTASRDLNNFNECDVHPCLPRYTDTTESVHVGSYIYNGPKFLRDKFDRPTDSAVPVESR